MSADYNDKRRYIKVGVLAGEPEPQGASTTKRLRRGRLIVVCACDEMASAGTIPPPSPKTSDRTTTTPGKETIRNRAQR